MSSTCNDCGSDNIGWDAWVDENNEVVGGPYDNCQCMDCGSEDIDT
jgi:hypothetical protein